MSADRLSDLVLLAVFSPVMLGHSITFNMVVPDLAPLDQQAGVDSMAREMLEVIRKQADAIKQQALAGAIR